LGPKIARIKPWAGAEGHDGRAPAL
jgi:hypothetical protein